MRTNEGEQLSRVEVKAAKEMTKAESYAASLVELAKIDAGLDAVEEDLRFVKETVGEHINLRGALADPVVPAEKKQKIVEDIFKAKVADVTLNFIQLLVGMGQVELLPEIADEFTRRLEQVENKVVAEVTTAIDLDDAMVAHLTERLKALTGKQVTVRAKVDPAIVGGIVVRLGGRLLDGSIRHQLERLRQQMSVDLRGR